MSNKTCTHLGSIMGFNRPLIASTKPGGSSDRKGGCDSIMLIEIENHQQQNYQYQNHDQNQLICQQRSFKIVEKSNIGIKMMNDNLNSRGFENRLRRNNHNTTIRRIRTTTNNSNNNNIDRRYLSNNIQFISFNQPLNTSKSARNKILTKMRPNKRNIVQSPIGEQRCLCLMMLTLVAIASSSNSWFANSQILEISPNQVPAMINLATDFPASIETQQLSSLSSSLNSDQLKNLLYNNNNINKINYDRIDTNNSNNLTEAIIAAIGAVNGVQSLVASKNLEPKSYNSDGFYQDNPEFKHQQQTTISTDKIKPQQQRELEQQQQKQPVATTTQTPLVESQLVAPSMGSPQVDTMVTAASKKKKKMMKKKKKMEKKHKEWKKGKKHKKKKYEKKHKKGGMSKKKKGK